MGGLYDFNGGGPLTGLAEVARDGGYAAEFTNQTEWQQELTATLKIVNGDLVVDDYIWRDVK